MIEPKPVPSDAILTDAQAAERYNVEVETWGERLSRAGARICHAIVADGAPLPFACPDAASTTARP
ncbi:MAG: hypothetical protein P0Y64_02145 [Candidatus Sphingomonas colombiensis]|nr:hypothetical protein [Sphingomonas sp.]WEK43657.1 MAG: hypothetical protein P0Y64_02145 [Sphingomonas sp.]